MWPLLWGWIVTPNGSINKVISFGPVNGRRSDRRNAGIGRDHGEAPLAAVAHALVLSRFRMKSLSLVMWEKASA